jgi:hypothetical protein
VLKGTWLQACVYTADESRVITDVDLLVPREDFGRAQLGLLRAGWHVHSVNSRAATLHHPRFALPIDLHHRLFTRGAFVLSTADVLARARFDDTAFSAGVLLPDPRDGYAHLIGHFIKSRMRCDDWDRLRDFTVVAIRCRLDADDTARHLHQAGMARAARYVARLLERQGDAFHRDLIAALPDDAVGEQLARISRLVATRSSAGGLLGALPGFLLDRSLWGGAGALALRALDLPAERASRSKPPR